MDQWLHIVKSQTPPVALSASADYEQMTDSEASANPPPIRIFLKDGKQVVRIDKSLGGSDTDSNSPSEKDEVDEATSKKQKKDISDKSRSSSSSSKSSSSRHKSSSSSSSKKSSSSSRHSKDKSSSSSSKSSDSKDKDRHRSSSSKSSSRDKDREKDRYKSKSSSSSKDKDSSLSKDKDSSLSKDKEYYKDKVSSSSSSIKKSEKIDKPSERDKILEKLAKITKKTREEDNSPTSITVPSKKASISIEIKRDADRTSAVKTYKSQFRSHGLTEEAPPPPSRKGLKKPVSQQSSVYPQTIQAMPLSLKRPSPTKDLGVGVTCEKRAKIDIVSSSPTSVPEKVGGVKLIAAKPKRKLLFGDLTNRVFSLFLSEGFIHHLCLCVCCCWFQKPANLFQFISFSLLFKFSYWVCWVSNSACWVDGLP